jgi:hypothetical protein
VTALAAFAAGITGAALAAPATASPAAHAAGQAAGAAAAAGQPSGGPYSPAGTAHGGRIVLASHAAHRHPHARHVARVMMHHRFHWSVRKQYKYLSRLWDRESGWNRYAYNPYSGAYGIPQAVPGSKMASAGSHWRSRARTQIKWGLRYIRSRYGTPHHAWQHSQAYGWY